MHRTRALLLAFTAAVAAAAALAPAASAGLLKSTGGIVSYTEADPNARNALTVRMSSDGSRITFTDSGRTSGSAIRIRTDGSCTVSRASGSCPAAGVTRIDVATGELDDTVTQSTGIPSGLMGGIGNDRLTGGTGDDRLVGEAGADTLNGGTGRDSAEYGERSAPLTITLDGKAGDGEQGENDNVAADIEVVAGGAAADAVTGSDADNTLYGNAGNDTLSGGGGNDQLDGGSEDDLLDGGAGADALVGGEGTDTATYANSGAGVRVTLDDKPGDGAAGENDSADVESVAGSGGDDVLIGNAGANVLTGGGGNDRLLGGAGADALDSGPGDDILQSIDGVKDLIACGDGEDGIVSDRSDVRSDCEYIKYRVLAASATALRLSDGAVRIPVRCSPATVDGCRGRLSLRVGKRVVGGRIAKLVPGRRWVAKIRLTRRGRAMLRRTRLLKASLVVRDRDSAGVLTVTTQTVRIAR